ncbi:MAG TPA: LytR C-terminal domain-containing protein [Pseudonocardiaceae bacterium]|nr:LytR C-terminal domain-containing protein [Pseudonocardiaceae bacterium]
MSASPTGPVRPARLAGFILLGVAVVAVGLGIFALADSAAGQTTTSGPTSQVTAPETFTPTTTKSTPPKTTTAAPTTTPSPTTTTTAGPTTTVIPPPSGTPAPPPVQVRVYNNGTIKGLAARAAADLTNAGFDVVQVGNYAQGDIPTSTAYYTPAPGEQATAQAIGTKFGMRVLPRFPGIADASPGVIVIITNDFKG